MPLAALSWQITTSYSSRCSNRKEVPLQGAPWCAQPPPRLPMRVGVYSFRHSSPPVHEQITVHGSMFQQSDHLKCKFKRVPNENCGEGTAAHNSTCDMAPVTTVDATFLTYWSLKVRLVPP